MRRILFISAACLCAPSAAFAQNPDAGKYFNFSLRSTTTSKTFLQGSLVVSGTTGQFSAMPTSTATYYVHSGTQVTAYGITNSTAWSGREGNTNYPSTSVGTYADGRTAGTYYVDSINVGFTTTAGSHFVAVGSVSAAATAGFDIYNATYANGVYTLGTTTAVANEKMVAAGSFSETAAFSTTALASEATVPEIDGGTLPRGLLLIFLSFIILRAWRPRKRNEARCHNSRDAFAQEHQRLAPHA